MKKHLSQLKVVGSNPTHPTNGYTYATLAFPEQLNSIQLTNIFESYFNQFFCFLNRF